MNKKRAYLSVIFLILACLIAFGTIAGNDFINLDDPGYIIENNIVQSGLNFQNIKWAFTSVVLANWHPLTMISYMLEWQLFGANPAGYHIVSLMLHIGAVIILFLFLYKSTKHFWPSAFAAALFALHPLRVESVAWVAERKDVLSMFFGMACLWAYSSYCEKRKSSSYLICLILFTLSLLSKPMLVTLPFVMLLLDFWPFHRWQKALQEKGSFFQKIQSLIYEKIPFFMITIVSSAITLWAQSKGGAVSSLKNLPFIERLENAFVSYTAYLGKMICPVHLAVFYPFETPLPLLEIVSSAMIIILITFIVLAYTKKLPFLFVGWCWYIGTLIPVIGLIQVGSQAMADRYTYMPSIGIAIMIAWGIPSFMKRMNIKKEILFLASITLLMIFSFLTWLQCGYWKNNFSLYEHALKSTRNNHMAHLSLGLSLSVERKFAEAIYHYNEVLRIIPDDLSTYTFRGIAYSEIGQNLKAIENFDKTVKLRANYADDFNNRGIAYFRLKQNDKAIEDFTKAISSKAEYADAFNNRGAALIKLEQPLRAIKDFSKAIQIKPEFAEAYYNRASVYEKQGQYQNAVNDLNKAIQLKPDIADYYYSRGIAYGKLEQNDLACRDFNKVIRLKPGNADAYLGRGVCLAKLGQSDLALADFQETIRLKPDYTNAFNNRAVFYFKTGDKKRGCIDAQKVCTLGNCQTLETAYKKGYCR